MISALLIKNMPASYLEGYNFLQKKITKYNWPEKPKAVLTANAHFNFDVFKFWLADKRKKYKTHYITTWCWIFIFKISFRL